MYVYCKFLPTVVDVQSSSSVKHSTKNIKKYNDSRP